MPFFQIMRGAGEMMIYDLPPLTIALDYTTPAATATATDTATATPTTITTTRAQASRSILGIIPWRRRTLNNKVQQVTLYFVYFTKDFTKDFKALRL